MAIEDNNLEYSRLEELSGSDFEIADGQPDIKGWDVKNDLGQVIGDVEELLFNPQTQKVRYMVVDTDANDLHLAARKILVPIGVAELHEDDDYIVVPQVTVAHIETLPDYEKGGLNAEHEQHIRSTFSSLGAAGMGMGAIGSTPTEDFYEHEQFNANRLYNRRRQEIEPEKLLPEHGTHDNLNNVNFNQNRINPDYPRPENDLP
jgi:sporulation protein YlmC with PRC-barrel domain